MGTRFSTDQAARAIRGVGSTKTQRAAQMSMHQGTLTRVDPFNGVADFQFADPGGVVLPSVRYVQTYSPTYQPQVGHVVWGIQTDTDFMIWAQHLMLNGRVTM